MRALLRGAWGGEEDREAREAAGRRLARLAASAAALLLVAQLLLLRDQAMQLVDEGETLGRAHYLMALGSGWGSAWWSATIAAVFALVSWIPGRAGPRLGWRLVPLAALALTATVPLSGHPRALRVGPLLGVLGGSLHLLGAGLWIGGLALLLFVVVVGGETGRDLRSARLITRFSALATVAAPVTIVTGTLLAWGTVGSFGAILGTAYGKTLDLKLLGVALVGLLGAYHYKVSVPRLAADPRDPSFVRTARLEVACSLLILVATAVLVALPAPGLD